MVGALKGHSGPVLDMNFSANGKFLATCADEAADIKLTSTSSSSKVTKEQQPPPSPSGSSKSSSSSSSSSEQEPQRTILSRRQRKNRLRAPRTREHDDDRPSSSSSSSSSSSPSSKQKHKNPAKAPQDKVKQSVLKPKCNKKSTMASFTSEYIYSKRAKLQECIKPSGYSDRSLYVMCREYLLSKKQMLELGYPYELSESSDNPMELPSRFCGYVTINHQPPFNGPRGHQHRSSSQRERKPAVHNLDVNAREFIPCSLSSNNWSDSLFNFCSREDSGRGSSIGSSPENSDFDQDSSSDSDKNSDIGDTPKHAVERRCARCTQPFYLSLFDGDYIDEESCRYHHGKFRGGRWDCCGSRDSYGCESARTHVWSGLEPGYNGPFADFVKTEPMYYEPLNGNYGVYAIDCEMCYTKRGLELARVTLIDMNGDVAYEAMVKPDAEIVDYNTRFSGLRPSDFVDAKSLCEVQKDLKFIICSETILIGHGLENDLRALRLVHPTVIDTAVCYPHVHGLPFRNSLKMLASKHLGKEIQCHQGHDSAEDAKTALNLIYAKLNKDFGSPKQVCSGSPLYRLMYPDTSDCCVYRLEETDSDCQIYIETDKMPPSFKVSRSNFVLV